MSDPNFETWVETPWTSSSFNPRNVERNDAHVAVTLVPEDEKLI